MVKAIDFTFSLVKDMGFMFNGRVYSSATTIMVAEIGTK
jgi:hypothetical protein